MASDFCFFSNPSLKIPHLVRIFLPWHNTCTHGEEELIVPEFSLGILRMAYDRLQMMICSTDVSFEPSSDGAGHDTEQGPLTPERVRALGSRMRPPLELVSSPVGGATTR